MKQSLAAVALVVCLVLAGCGAKSVNPATLNGGWNATLTDTGNTPAFTFGMSLLVNGDGTLSVNNFNFTSTSPCFASEVTETGSFTLSGTFNGSVTGKFGLVVQSGSPAGNTLTLAGNVNGNIVSGTWTLTGTTGCTGTGAFTMTKM